MKKLYAVGFLALVLLSSCDLLGGLFSTGFDMDPPRWVLGTWEADDGYTIVVKADDIEHGSGYLTSFSSLGFEVSDVSATDDYYEVEVSFIGESSYWSFSKNIDGTMTTGGKWGIKTYTKR